jgi:hypothetical protein
LTAGRQIKWKRQSIRTNRQGFADKLNTLAYLRLAIAVQSDILCISKHPRLKLVRTKTIIETNKTDITILGNSVISGSV